MDTDLNTQYLCEAHTTHQHLRLFTLPNCFGSESVNPRICLCWPRMDLLPSVAGIWGCCPNFISPESLVSSPTFFFEDNDDGGVRKWKWKVWVLHQNGITPQCCTGMGSLHKSYISQDFSVSQYRFPFDENVEKVVLVLYQTLILIESRYWIEFRKFPKNPDTSKALCFYGSHFPVDINPTIAFLSNSFAQTTSCNAYIHIAHIRTHIHWH